MPTAIPGALVVEQEPSRDERGWFARTFDRDEFGANGLVSEFPQASIAFNPRAGTLRGLHYQREPHSECKLVRCTRGRAFDVIVDLRPSSPAFRRWYARELSPDGGEQLYIPEGVAHGYQTLVADTELSYLIAGAYRPSAARGIRWDDPAFGIAWPPADRLTISERDRSYPDFTG